MRSIVDNFLDRILRDRRDRLRLTGLILLLAFIVVGIVIWSLHYTGVAMTNEVYCGMEEHLHDETCYEWELTCGLEESEGSEGHTHDNSCYETVTELVCGLEESEVHTHDDACFDGDGNLICVLPESEGHTHTDICYETTQVLICGQEEIPASAGHTHMASCYTQVLACGLEEHVHTMACMNDETADLETAKDWEATLPAEEDLTGVWGEDVVLIAESQIGYTESERNFVLDDDNDRRGYTRYGEWYGNAYGNWDAMFVSFCLSYAGVTEDHFPYNSGAYAWIAELKKLEAEDGTGGLHLYADKDDHIPVPGDIIFLDTDGDGKADRTGIVEEVETDDRSTGETAAAVWTVEGDCDGAVCENEYDLYDAVILGYGILPEDPDTADAEDVRNGTLLTGAEDADNTDEADPISAAADDGEPDETRTEDTDDTENASIVSASEEMEDGSAASEEPVEDDGSSASDEIENIYLITYSSNDPEVTEIEGPDSAEEGEDLVFRVTVAEGYELTEVMANDTALEPEDISVSDDGLVTVYSYLVADVEEDTVVVLEATQVLDGSGSVAVFEINSSKVDDADAEYTLYIDGAPTNTKISLDSPTITVWDNLQDKEVSINLNANLYYATDGTNSIENAARVAYLMLSDNVETEDSTEEEPEYAEGVFKITAYDENEKELTGGRLVLNIVGSDRVEIWNVQTNTLCSLDNGVYTQEIIGVAKPFEAITYYVGDYAEGNEISLEAITQTEGKDYKFYYGTVNGDNIKLTLCKKLVMEDGRALPVDPATGQAVADYGELFMAYDELYSFDVEVNNAVNELTEDNGDTYLWVGNEFYIDQYHSQGYYERGYTYKYSGGEYWYDIWVQLGIQREKEINGGTKSFSDYAAVSYSDFSSESWFNENTNITNNATDRAERSYGIVGPFEFEGGESAVTTTTVRVTGRVGESFTASEVFGTDFVYMINQNSTYISDWMDIGAHSTDDTGGRAWWYWINNVYQLNNYEDVCEYVQIYQDEQSGEVRLRADEIGNNEDTSGQLYDVWDLVGIYTKRESAVQSYMLENQEELEKLGIGFVEYPNWPMHVQLRLTNTVEIVLNGVIYNGTLSVVTDEGYEPTLTYDIAYGYRTGDVLVSPVYNSSGRTMTMDRNGMESSYVYFSTDIIYIPLNIAFDAEQTKITVKVYAVGTLYGEDGSEIVYDENNMLEYQYTLTSEQLKEAWDCCPCHDGYDIAVNLGNAVKLDTENQIILYKVWQDEENYIGARSNVNHVTVSLQRSKGGDPDDRDNWKWEDVVDSSGKRASFTIWGNSSSNVWTQVLTSSDLDLTWENEDTGESGVYYFRIDLEQDIDGVADNYGYGIQYTYEVDDTALIIVNTLNEYPIKITGTKVWNYDGYEYIDASLVPDSVVIALFQNDEFYQSVEINKENGWSFTFDNVPQALIRVSDGAGGYTYEYQYTYSLYELDPNGVAVGDGEVVPLDKGSYRVDIELVESGGTGGSSATSDFETVIEYKITNEFLVFPVSIYKYSEGDEDTESFSVTCSGWADGLGTETTYYLWGIADPDPDGEGGDPNPELIPLDTESASGGSYSYSQSGTGGLGMTASSAGTILIKGLPDGYTYYLTTNGSTFVKDGAVELALAYDSPSGGQPLAGAEFIISKTVNSGSDSDPDEGGDNASGETLYAVIDEETGMLKSWTSDKSDATVLTSNGDGLINVMLTTGTYYLTEIKAPDGYNLLFEPIEFEVTSSGVKLVVPVYNPPGVELPVTGGAGVFWFTLAGLAVTAAAGGALMYNANKKRKGAEQA